MTGTARISPPPPAHHAERAIGLALRLSQAENALLALTEGQVDAIVDPSGKTYLLRPAQEHLRQSEERLHAVIDSAADVITVVNRGGVILSQSNAVRRVLGYEPGELVGSSIFKRIHEDDLQAVHSAFLHVVEGSEESATTRFFHRDGDGSYRMIEATVGSLRDLSSPSVVFSMRSMASPLRGPPEPASHGASPVKPPIARDRFLAILSHELRTPLMPALLGIQMLEEDPRFAEALPTLRMIRRNIELESHLLEELSDYSSVGQHKLRLRLESVDAHQAVHFVLEICQSDIAAAKIEVLLYLRAEESSVVADSVRLQQVLWNLVKNAVKFSTPGGSISVASTNEDAGDLVIEITDHGIGIEPELLPLIFDPFKQGELLGPHSKGGLGLGLFIAKGLAEAQGGTLTVASQGLGQGATFRLTLIKAAERP